MVFLQHNTAAPAFSSVATGSVSLSATSVTMTTTAGTGATSRTAVRSSAQLSFYPLPHIPPSLSSSSPIHPSLPPLLFISHPLEGNSHPNPFIQGLLPLPLPPSERLCVLLSSLQPTPPAEAATSPAPADAASTRSGSVTARTTAKTTQTKKAVVWIPPTVRTLL